MTEVVEPFAVMEVLDAEIVDVLATATPGVTEMADDSITVRLPELKVSL
jgi:hypothetical protein